MFVGFLATPLKAELILLKWKPESNCQNGWKKNNWDNFLRAFLEMSVIFSIFTIFIVQILSVFETLYPQTSKMVQVYLFNLLRERQGDLREGKVCAKTGKGKWCGEIGPTFSFFIIIFDFIQKVVFCVNMFSKVKYTIKYSSLLHCVRPSNLKLSGTSLYFFCWKKVKAPWKVLFSHTLSIIRFAT